MTVENINEAEQEAKRFLKRLKELKSAYPQTFKSEKWLSGSKQSGAVRRSSMDLTRSLAKMRSYE